MLLVDPNLPRVRLELGALYFRLGSFEIARTYLESALAAPNVPPAPDRLSTTTCWLHIRLSRSVIRRAMMSGEPPAGKGTM